MKAGCETMYCLSRSSLAWLLVAVLVGCGGADESDHADRTPGDGDDAARTASQEVDSQDEASDAEAFDTLADSLIDEMLERSPEWAIHEGHYENAGEVTIPDAAHRESRMAFVDDALERLEAFDRERLGAQRRADHDLLVNHLESMRFYTETLRDWEWQPSKYNVAGELNILLETDFAPVDERLALIRDRLASVPAYYAAARESLGTPTLEHTELAIRQNRGGLAVLGRIRERAAEADLHGDLETSLERSLDSAESALESWIEWLEQQLQALEESGQARSFRLGEQLYERKFALDIQADFTAAELYERARAEKRRLLGEMDGYARELWPEYFPDEPLPDERLERIGRLIERLSDEHASADGFVDEIRRQVPELAEFVRDNDLLEQDPDKPLVVRETPQYMRGTGAIASVSAPGPFNPQADTYYNVTPLETYGEEQAASYLREYNDWMLQILNIHEAIPGHYTQLLHANRSPSLVKSLFGNGAMIEGWAVYAERMMLEAGWGDHEPELWLMHGKWLLRVTHNAILDYAVHVLGMERDEAVRMMQVEAFQERSEATQKWRRLTLSQVQLTSYYAGYAAIMELRERLKAERGDAFDLEAFHNEFLGYGSAPVDTIAELMLSGSRSGD